MNQPRALVIGGSLSGLFTANLLRTIGWHVEVFDLQPDGRYRLLTETVRMRSFGIDQIRDALRPRFADLETIDGAGQPVADDGPGRIWFSCVKPG